MKDIIVVSRWHSVEDPYRDLYTGYGPFIQGVTQLTQLFVIINRVQLYNIDSHLSVCLERDFVKCSRLDRIRNAIISAHVCRVAFRNCWRRRYDIIVERAE